MEIVPNVHLIASRIVNCYLIIQSDGLTLIDTGTPGFDKKIISYINALGHPIAALKQILITHSDGDHAGSLAALKAVSGAQTYASAIEAEAIEAGLASRLPNFTGIGKLLARFTKTFFEYSPCQIDHHLTPGQDLPILDRLWIVPTPGHTPGHISFYSASAKTLFAGDAVRAVRDELVLINGPITWDAVEAKQTVRLLAAMRPRIVCPGHGAVVKNAVGKFPE